ncbi:MAG: Tex family protein [Clostridium sp.]
MEFIIEQLVKEFNLKLSQVNNVIDMLNEGCTVPFIARYRKERTEGMDDIVLRDFHERLAYLTSLEDRKGAIIKNISDQGKITEELKIIIKSCNTLTEVEDVYRPYKQKKRTRAIIATEKGLKPLADLILMGEFKGNIESEAALYVNEENGVKSIEEAILGASDINAEVISDEAKYRKWIRELLNREAFVETKKSQSKVKDETNKVTPYEMYYEYKELVRRVLPHNILAINRGEKEKVISVKITCDENKILTYLNNRVLKDNPTTNAYLEESIKDSLKRLIYPSVEREIRAQLTEKGEDSAINVFKANLKSLLMQAPIKGNIVLGYDPGFRTGCKIAVLDETGKVLDTAVVNAALPNDNKERAINDLINLVEKNNVSVISLGNGTACRESEEVLAEVIKRIKVEKNRDLYYVIVSESGASVYSASELATKEYPDLDVSIRGAISIGRRLQDPLAELVKIDPKALGVGQYQHDVAPKKLEESLDGVIEDCVNNVGIDLNTATPSLLTHISGINTTIAKNIVDYREENGKFLSRAEIKKVKRLGTKAFEQCAGFLRVRNSKEWLDNTSVHPESYKVAKELLKKLGYKSEELKEGNITDIDNKVNSINIKTLCEELNIGELTLIDIIKEIKKQGRDPREELQKPIFKTGVMELSQLKTGMSLMGTVRNVADFGAFVDIGVHQDGLVHKSQLADRFVNHPLDVVKVGDIVQVRIIEVDEKRGRISLTMKKES